MKKVKLHLTFLICSLLYACSTSRSYQQETIQLNNYLDKELHTKIGTVKSIYIFIPGTQCENCSKSLGANIDAATQIPVTIITGYKFVNKKYKAFIDYKNRMAKMPFLNYSNTIALTLNGQIIAIEPFSDTTNLLRFYKQ